MNKAEYQQHFQHYFRHAPYFSSGRYWRDYAPAYAYALDCWISCPGCRFEQVEARLAEDWPRVAGESRLGWSEAREAVIDAWQFIESRQPGAFHTVADEVPPPPRC
ncbi:hypothetical protein EBB59_09020 [Lysobacter pythonis]|uniref:Uncharacterized protein n=1 Tax=Solilutibacter pythonis TaxID=2483112 RepID=A0A3M2HMH0_9GAMM|nr:hypothetical protein [Lysobacter pythonis]RMH90911.1 hypothetical protein EBB59_09020 [Lysobacter pythonis]